MNIKEMQTLALSLPTRTLILKLEELASQTAMATREIDTMGMLGVYRDEVTKRALRGDDCVCDAQPELATS